MKNKSIVPLLVIGGAAVFAVLLIALGGRVNPGPNGGGHPGSGFNQPPDPAELLGTNPILGQADAPVTLVEFGDYQCTFCTRFFKETEPTLIEKYVKTGKLKIVFRNLAINGRESQNAAEAAQCAADQGKFWEYHDRLFNERRGYNVGVFNKDNLVKFAVDLGLDENQFAGCYNSDRHKDLIAQDGRDAARFGARGTPTFFVNGQQLVGAQPAYVFESAIQQIIGN